MNHANKQSIVDSLCLSAGRVTTLLDGRDRQGFDFHGQDRRHHPRHAFHRQTKLVMTTFNAEGSSVRYAVASRNLSESGASFLHGAFLSDNTTCVISMCNVYKQWINVVAKVVRCTLIEDRVYEIGIQLINKVDTRCLVSKDARLSPSQHEYPRLVGRALCVVASYDDRRELRDQLTRLGVICVMTNLGQEAVALVEGEVPFDLVIADEHLSDMSGRDLMMQLKQRGRAAPVILMGEDSGQDNVVVLTKPLRQESLAAILLQWLSLASAKSQKRDSNPFGPHQRMDVHMTLVQAAVNDVSAERAELAAMCMKIQKLARLSGADGAAMIAGEMAQQILEDHSEQDAFDQCKELAALRKKA